MEKPFDLPLPIWDENKKPIRLTVRGTAAAALRANLDNKMAAEHRTKYNTTIVSILASELDPTYNPIGSEQQKYKAIQKKLKEVILAEKLDGFAEAVLVILNRHFDATKN